MAPTTAVTRDVEQNVIRAIATQSSTHKSAHHHKFTNQQKQDTTTRSHLRSRFWQFLVEKNIVMEREISPLLVSSVTAGSSRKRTKLGEQMGFEPLTQDRIDDFFKVSHMVDDSCTAAETQTPASKAYSCDRLTDPAAASCVILSPTQNFGICIEEHDQLFKVHRSARACVPDLGLLGCSGMASAALVCFVRRLVASVFHH